MLRDQAGAAMDNVWPHMQRLSIELPWSVVSDQPVWHECVCMRAEGEFSACNATLTIVDGSICFSVDRCVAVCIHYATFGATRR